MKGNRLTNRGLCLALVLTLLLGMMPASFAESGAAARAEALDTAVTPPPER